MSALGVAGWAMKREWKLVGRTFAVVVSCHEADEDAQCGTGRFRWAVYAYLYPLHPLFARIPVGTGMFDVPPMPLHGGCSLVRHHRDAAAVASVQVGADYNHLHDEAFTHVEEFGGVVRRDADELFAFLSDATEAKS